LRQNALDRWTAYVEWLLDIRLTPGQQRDFQQAFRQRWQLLASAERERYALRAETELAWFQDVLRRDAEEHDAWRGQKRTLFVAALRKSSDRADRLLLEMYESAHLPGGEKNPILIPGSPPLTRQMVEQRQRFSEWVLDVRLTEEQRKRFQQLMIEEWKQLDQQARDLTVKRSWEAVLARLPSLNSYQRNLLRAELQARLLIDLRQRPKSPLGLWLLDIYGLVHRPGSRGNPILVTGSPALTQEMTEQYADFLEWVLDLRFSGGLSEPQRRVLREHLIGAWKKLNSAGKDRFVAFLSRWRDIVQMPELERSRLLDRLQPEFLESLQSSGDDEYSRWLLSISEKERALANGSREADPAR
jgi:hypothetical protein